MGVGGGGAPFPKAEPPEHSNGFNAPGSDPTLYLRLGLAGSGNTFPGPLKVLGLFLQAGGNVSRPTPLRVEPVDFIETQGLVTSTPTREGIFEGGS